MRKNISLGIGLLLLGGFLSGCSPNQSESKSAKQIADYDMRNGLSPSRLTIAMWDFSWLYQHYPGGFFEDYHQVCDELVVRGFNTVRIDAFPLIIGKLSSNEQEVTIEGDPLRNWGASDRDREHAVLSELLEFMSITREKNIHVILSSWGHWWHMDHKDLNWEWLYDWCEECMGLASEYKLWGTTPWNYSHPYWENWNNTDWYNKVNGSFLKN